MHSTIFRLLVHYVNLLVYVLMRLNSGRPLVVPGLQVGGNPSEC